MAHKTLIVHMTAKKINFGDQIENRNKKPTF